MRATERRWDEAFKCEMLVHLRSSVSLLDKRARRQKANEDRLED